MLLQEIKNIKSTKKELKDFGLVVGVVLAGIGGLLLWKGRGTSVYFLGAGAFLTAAGLTFPVMLKPLQKVWMTFAVIMGWFMSRLILSVIFYLVMTPIRMIATIFGQRFLDMKLEPGKKTYWNYRASGELDVKTYEHQF